MILIQKRLWRLIIYQSALPKDASEGFGDMFLEHVIPAFFNDDRDGILKRARITISERTLNRRFSYLQEYVDGKDGTFF